VASPFDRFVRSQGFAVLDGGLATALEARGHALDTDLWSARLLLDAPEAIRDVHAAYLEAGADCISTASYQASLVGFAEAGIAADEGERLLRRSVELAREARDAFWSDPTSREGRLRPLVAASLGPYGAYLADGSEYDGRYAVPEGPGVVSIGAVSDDPGEDAVRVRPDAPPRRVGPEALAAFHGPRLESLAEAGADLLALETLPSLVEVRVLVGLLAQVRHPGAWLSFTCRDASRLRDGSPVEEAVRACSPGAGVVAVGVNCTAPEHVAGLIRRMRAASDLPILAYPNSGELYDAANGAWSGGPAAHEWLELVPEWVGAGARIVGGCCRIGPETIRLLRRRLERGRHSGSDT
jgi:homocysteine S-methyltransferase